MPLSSRTSVLREIKASLVLAGPVVASQLAQMSMGFVDTLMVGRLGTASLAGVALGNTVFFTTLLICLGVVIAVGPMVSQAYGAGEEEPISRSVRQGFWMALTLTVPAFLFLWNAGALLRAVGQEPETVALTERYLRAIVWGFLPALWFAALRSLAEGLSKPWPVTIIAFCGIGLNIAANAALMFGRWGFPALGLEGTGWASTMVFWTLFGALALYVQFRPGFRRYPIFARIGRPDPQYFRELFRIGWPIGVAYGIEAGFFTMTALLVGLFGTTTLAAHHIAIQCASFTFMVPLGIGVAGSVRVGQAAGRGDADGVQQAGWVAIGLAVTAMLAAATLFWTVPRSVVGLYLDTADPANADVVPLAVMLLGVAAVFQVFDGVQVAAAGALRGLKDTRVPMLIGFFSYWVVGLSAGYVLGFVLGWGATGLWWGLVIGLAMAAVLLSRRFHRRIRLVETAPGPRVKPPETPGDAQPRRRVHARATEKQISPPAA